MTASHCLFLALLEQRPNNQRVEPLLVLRSSKAWQRLEAPRPGFDILVVFRAAEGFEDAVPRVAGWLAVRELLDKHPPYFHGGIVTAAIEIVPALAVEHCRELRVARVVLSEEFERLGVHLRSAG